MLQIERLGSPTEAVQKLALLILEEYCALGSQMEVLGQMQPFWQQRNARLKLALVKVTSSAALNHQVGLGARVCLIYRPLAALLKGPPR